jgi:long-chain fatty acid transport protein
VLHYICPLKLKLNFKLMRKLLTIVAALLISGAIFAGGLVTNTNQSAMFTRLQNRNASTAIDAVYFNPAGVTKLGDGFFASINNQTISQTQTIINDYSFLSGSPKQYIGDVSAPVYPGVYVAYNTGKLSLSAGFNPVGGGGGATYKKGLPSFETNVADLVPLLSSQGFPTTQYSADIYFKGTSVYFGYQFNVGYKINDMISVAAGLRLVSAKNTYNGYLRDISVNPNYPAFGSAFTGGMVLASDFFTAGATVLNTLAAGSAAFVTGLQPIVDAGAGATLLANGESVGLSTAQVGQIQQLLGAAGLTPAQIGAISIAGAQGTLAVAGPEFTQNAAAMSAYAAQTQDVNVDAEESGTGYTPIISVNISPTENLNIAVKYEFKTKLDLTTKVKNNMGGGIFIAGEKVVADMPALLSLGVEYKPISKLMLTGSFNTYFDKNVNYTGSATDDTKEIDKNFLEFGLGAEYGISDKLRISGGWVHTSTGVNSLYQSDQRYSANTNSFGAGFGYRISDMIDLNLGGQYTFYADASRDFTDIAPYTETYKKKTWLIGVGLDFSFGKK